MQTELGIPKGRVTAPACRMGIRSKRIYARDGRVIPAVNLRNKILENGVVTGHLMRRMAASAIRTKFFPIALAALLMIAPFILWGYPNGPDLGFYASCWLDTTHQWMHGVVWPQWSGLANFGLGDPRLSFYPPLSQILGAAFCLFLPVKLATGAYLWGILVLSGYSCYELACRLGFKQSALQSAVIYILNPYFMLDVHRRLAIPELLACAVLPLSIAATLELGRHKSAAWVALAGTEAIIGISNLPIFIVSLFSCVIILGVKTFLERDLRIWPHFAFSVVVAFALDAFYLLPLARHLQWIQPSWVLSDPPRNHFLFRLTAQTLTSAVDIGAWVSGGCEILLLVFLAIRMLVIERNAVPRVPQPQCRLLMYTALLSFLILLPISEPIWAYLPGMRYVQFPWRWLALTSVIFAVLLPGFMITKPLRSKVYGYILVGVAVLAGFGIPLQGYVRGLRFDINAWQKEASSAGVVGYHEYAPLGTNIVFAEPTHTVPVLCSSSSPCDVTVTSWRENRKDFDVNMVRPDQLTVHLYSFPQWHAYLNGRQVAHQVADGEVSLLAPPGHNHFELRFEMTKEHVIGLFISVMTLLLTIWELLRLGVLRKRSIKYASPTASEISGALH